MLHQTRLTLAPLALLALLPASSALAAPADAPPAPAKPAAAPATTGPRVSPVDDKTFAKTVLEPRKGKAVLVSFWASYCVPCLKELPLLGELKQRAVKKGADVVVVSVDPPDVDLRKAPTTKDLNIDTLQVANEDPQLFIDAIDKKWFGEVPFAVIYGKDGKLKKSLSGEQTIDALEKALDEALK